jgi:NAD-dependent deacetylase
VRDDWSGAAQKFLDANYAVALTGAGISTPSGIPDFRSPNSGLWENVNAVETASIFGFRRHPQAFFNWMRPFARLIVAAEPNPAHRALADLEAAGYIRSIITQNIDMLHSKAGSKVVVEVHGNLRKATCIECFTEYDARPLIQEFIDNGTIPRCTKCGGILKPNVILFGEQLPVRELYAAQQAVRQCDLMLIVGSSLQVAPAGDIPTMVKQNAGRLIIVNYQHTHADGLADVVIRDNVAEVLPRIAATVMEAS